MREIAVLKRLDHPNVVRLHEIIDPPGSGYIMMVMEYMDDGPVINMEGQSGFERCVVVGHGGHGRHGRYSH